MQRSFNTQAVILKKTPIWENDINITLYCPLLGKIQAIAKGARKTSSHWSGNLEPMNLCQVQLYKSASRFTITQCQVEKNFKNIYKKMETVSMALLILEIFQKSTYASEHSQELFGLISDTFYRLNCSQEPFLVLERFKLHLLKLNGALPNMTTCVFCYQRWNDLTEIHLDKHGHFSCGNCVETNCVKIHCNRIAFEIIKLICYLLDEPAGHIKIRISTSQKQQLQLITHIFLQHFIAREIVGERIHEKMAAA